MDQIKNKTRHPQVLKNGAKKWPPFAWDLNHWCSLLKESLGDRDFIKLRFVFGHLIGIPKVFNFSNN